MRRARGKKKNVRTQTPDTIHTDIVRKKKKKRSPKKIILISVILILAAIIIALGMGFVDEADLLAPIDRESGKVNALILGTDEGGLRTDSIMVASFDLDTAEINLLSIPRDTKLYVKNRKLTRKATEIHAMSTKDGSGSIMGPIGTAEAVTQLTGIPINYYVEFTFDAIENLFNTLGPISYDVPDVEGGGKGMNYEDPYQDLYIHLKPGVQELDGDKLLQLMRYRKGDSDFARMERQQNVIKAMVDQKLNFSLIMKMPQLFSQLKKDITTNISAADVSKYAKYLGELSSDKVRSYQLPGQSEHIKAGWYFICDIDATMTLISETFGFDSSNITTDIEVYGKGSTAKAIVSKKKVTGTKSASPTATPKPKASSTAKPSASTTPKASSTAKPSTSPTPKPTSAPTSSPADEKPSAAPTHKPTPTPETSSTQKPISLDD